MYLKGGRDTQRKEMGSQIWYLRLQQLEPEIRKLS